MRMCSVQQTLLFCWLGPLPLHWRHSASPVRIIIIDGFDACVPYAEIFRMDLGLPLERSTVHVIDRELQRQACVHSRVLAEPINREAGTESVAAKMHALRCLNLHKSITQTATGRYVRLSAEGGNFAAVRHIGGCLTRYRRHNIQLRLVAALELLRSLADDQSSPSCQYQGARRRRVILHELRARASNSYPRCRRWRCHLSCKPHFTIQVKPVTSSRTNIDKMITQ